jgi:signal transduction histidine kinase
MQELRQSATVQRQQFNLLQSREQKLAASIDESALDSELNHGLSLPKYEGERQGERLEAIVETLASAQSQGEGLAALAHDARNMVTALGVYCTLLESPGVLSPAYRHYGSELRLLAAACRRLVEKLVALDATPKAKVRSSREFSESRLAEGDSPQGRQANAQLLYTQAEPISNLALELRANRNLLAALSGPAIQLRMVTHGGELPVRLSGEDLTRILVNLVKNSAEAMPGGGEIEIALVEEIATGEAATQAMPARLRLTLSDNGPGIPEDALEAVFAAGFTTRSETDPDSNWPGQHRGLGLSITRSIVESIGGTIRAFRAPKGGAGFEILLPVASPSWVAPQATRKAATVSKQQVNPG